MEDQLSRDLSDCYVDDDFEDSNHGGDLSNQGHDSSHGTDSNHSSNHDRDKSNAWRQMAYCLHCPTINNYYELKSKNIRNKLKEAGLGLVILDVRDWENLSEKQFEDIVYGTFPLLANGGGFELLTCSRRNSNFSVLPRPYRPVLLRPEVQEGQLFIRPMERNILNARMDNVVSIDLAEGDNSSDAYQSENGQRKAGKTRSQTAQLRKLNFVNPGKFMEDFDPERSSREMRKMKRKIAGQKPRKQAAYDEKGRLLVDKRDLCDCCERQCPGCHLPCPKCFSSKCGQECRINRRYVYQQVDAEGTNRSYLFADIGR